MAKRYYWLKLQKDFFKRPDIKIIESQPDGILYCYFYMKLLLESLEMQGILRYNDVPLDISMLSALTNTSPSVVKSAIDIFLKMNMIEILEDGALFLSEVALLLDSETEDARRKRAKKESIALIEEKIKKVPMTTAERVKKFREKQKLQISLEKNVTELEEICNENVTKVVTKCNEKNVTCNENVTENVTKYFLKSIDNKAINDVTENFRKNSIEQDIDIEQDIYTCHDHERDNEIENIFKNLEINYTNTNLESTNVILEKLKGDKELLKEYLTTFYTQTIKNAFNIQNKSAFFSAKLKTPDEALIKKLLSKKSLKLEEENKKIEKLKEIELLEEKKKREEEQRVETDSILKKFNELSIEKQEKILHIAEEKRLKKVPDIATSLYLFKENSKTTYYRMLSSDIKEVFLEENLL